MVRVVSGLKEDAFPLAFPREFVIDARTAAGAVAALAALGALARYTPDTSPWGWMVRVASTAFLIGVAPGALAVLAWRPRRVLEPIEWIGLSIAVSCVIVQLLTIATVTFHQPPARAVATLGVIAAAHWAVVFWKHDDRSLHIRVGLIDVLLLVMMTAIALFLYADGSPFVAQQEERIHISIIQRLSRLDSPSFENIYLSPGVVYTYPFPGTHYLMALMSLVGDVEPAFLYHKLRAFWGVAALVLLWGCARVIFDDARIALASLLVAIAFVANGTFAAWSQMAPFSHAADVAMGVLLPALLLLALSYLRAVEPRERRLFLVATLGMALMLTMVHPREIVQLIGYLAAFSVTLIIVRGPRQLLTRSALLLGLLALVLGVYRIWYALAVTTVDSIVTERQADLATLWMESSWTTLFGQPLPLLDAYMPAFALMFRWWMPVVLLASPFVLYLLRHQPLTWLVASGIAVYLAVIRFPVLAVPYTYVTYFEILYAPVRNVALFVHMLAGVCVYVLAAKFAERGAIAACLLAAVAALSVIQLFTHLGPIALEHIDLVFVPVLIGNLLVLIAMAWRRGMVRSPAWLQAPPARWPVVFAVILLPIVVGTWTGESAVAKLPWTNRQPTPAALVASISCGENRDRCAPSPALIQYVREHIPAEAVLAVDYYQVNEPTLFLPQQVDVWSGAIEGLVEPERTFPMYFKYLAKAQAASVDQPFFNERETREERRAFIGDLGVTHVLVSPRIYTLTATVFGQDPDLFVPRFDDGQWALYEVRR